MATFGNPGDFRTETLDVILFFVESSFSDEHWKVAVLNAKFFNSAIEKFCNLLPDKKALWSQDVASRDFIILNHV